MMRTNFRNARIDALRGVAILLILAAHFGLHAMAENPVSGGQTASRQTKLAASSSADSQKTVVVLGDSLAAGYGLDPGEAFPALLQTNVNKAGWHFTVINAGISGDTTAGGLRRMHWLLKRPIDVLIVELGGNDGLRGISTDATRTNLQAIIDRARQKNPETKIILAGMQMPPNMGDAYNHAFQKIYPDLAKQNDAALIPFLLEGVGGRPELNQADQIHPTAAGDKIVAENVWKVLSPILQKIDSPK